MACRGRGSALLSFKFKWRYYVVLSPTSDSTEGDWYLLMHCARRRSRSRGVTYVRETIHREIHLKKPLHSLRPTCSIGDVCVFRSPCTSVLWSPAVKRARFTNWKYPINRTHRDCFIIYQALNPHHKSARTANMAAVFWREKEARKAGMNAD